MTKRKRTVTQGNSCAESGCTQAFTRKTAAGGDLAPGTADTYPPLAPGHLLALLQPRPPAQVHLPPPHPHLPPAVRAGCHFTRPKIRYSVGGGNSGGPDRRGGERRAHTENHWPWRRRLGELVEDRLVRENWAVAIYGREFRLRRRGLRSEPADG